MSAALLLSFATVLPWVHGFTPSEATQGYSDEPPGWQELGDPECAGDASAPLRLTADVSPAAGRETIEASLTNGMKITSAEGVVLAAMPGFPCEGSADSLDILAAGPLFGEPTIVLVITTGGHREQMTWIGVFRIGVGGDINALFAGAVEIREDGVTETGQVSFLPGALIYWPPGHGPSLWVFDPVIHTYFPRGPFDHDVEDPTHAMRTAIMPSDRIADLARTVAGAQARRWMNGEACFVAATMRSRAWPNTPVAATRALSPPPSSGSCPNI